MRFRARNQVGWSEFSQILRVGLGSEPPALTTLTADIPDCGPTYVALKWSPLPTASLALPVLGYIVQMIDPVSDEWLDVLDASSDQDRLSYVYYGATTGQIYTFRAFAVNFNGRSSQPGNSVAVLACGLPRYMDQPVRVTSSSTSITLKWSPPADDGGCPIYDYEVLREPDGAGPWVEVNPARRNDPTLDEFVCTTFPIGAALGASFKFKIVAANRQGTVESLESAPMLWAGVPGAPPGAPVSDAQVTNQRRIKVDYQAVTATGGSSILSYELHMGSPSLNDWRALVGADPYTLSLEHTVEQGIKRGEDYTFRYRAVNSVGAGPWSEVATVTAAGAPSAPGPMRRIASDATSITLEFNTTNVENGGSKILGYKLRRDDGSNPSPVSISIDEGTYDGWAA